MIKDEMMLITCFFKITVNAQYKNKKEKEWDDGNKNSKSGIKVIKEIPALVFLSFIKKCLFLHIMPFHASTSHRSYWSCQLFLHQIFFCQKIPVMHTIQE